MTLELESLTVDCIIGDLPEERTKAQRLMVDIRLEIDDAAAHSDSLADTVDYAALAAKVRRTLEAARCRMLERAAYLVATTCAAEPHVNEAVAKVSKRGAVPFLESASATFRLAHPGSH